MRNRAAIRSLTDGVNSPAIFISQSGQRPSPPTFSGRLPRFSKGCRRFVAPTSNWKAQCYESGQNQDLFTVGVAGNFFIKNICGILISVTLVASLIPALAQAQNLFVNSGSAIYEIAERK